MLSGPIRAEMHTLSGPLFEHPDAGLAHLGAAPIALPHALGKVAQHVGHGAIVETRLAQLAGECHAQAVQG